jgi:hypothetical protein
LPRFLKVGHGLGVGRMVRRGPGRFGYLLLGGYLHVIRLAGFRVGFLTGFLVRARINRVGLIRFGLRIGRGVNVGAVIGRGVIGRAGQIPFRVLRCPVVRVLGRGGDGFSCHVVPFFDSPGPGADTS